MEIMLLRSGTLSPTEEVQGMGQIVDRILQEAFVAKDWVWIRAQIVALVRMDEIEKMGDTANHLMSAETLRSLSRLS